jgi:uncharacterized protein YqiB (DUF1249 family)
MSKAVVSCQQVLRELSNYIDNDVDSQLRTEIEKHLSACGRCSVVLDTTRQVVRIYCDETVLEVPSGYSVKKARASYVGPSRQTSISRRQLA